jgi:hypothetical protein
VLEGADVRDVLPSIQAPTLVLAREENTWIRAEHGRFLAEHIPGAIYLEVPGRDYFPFIGDSEAVLSAIKQFVLNTAVVAQDTDRVLATLLFTDIVGSTSKAAELGDRAVATAARIMAEAGAGEVYLSGTVRDLTAGSGIDLHEAGMFTLRGVPGEWRLFAVANQP